MLSMRRNEETARGGKGQHDDREIERTVTSYSSKVEDLVQPHAEHDKA